MNFKKKKIKGDHKISPFQVQGGQKVIKRRYFL